MTGAHLQSIIDIGEVRFLHRAQRILKDNTHPVTVCSPCSFLTNDTGIFNAVPPECETAELILNEDSNVIFFLKTFL